MYTAVIARTPPESDTVTKLAFPELNGPVPDSVAPSKNWTTPLADPPATVAVNVRARPYVEGLELEASVVLVVILITSSNVPDDDPL